MLFSSKWDNDLVHVGETKGFFSVCKTGMHTQNKDYVIAEHHIQSNHNSAALLKFSGMKKNPFPTL